MRSQLRLFAVVGLLATAIDLGIFIGLARWTDKMLWLANACALVAAAAVSYLGNRWVTFRGDHDARWVSQPWMFGITALLAGFVDMVVLRSAFFLTPLIGLGWGLAKVIAIAAAATVRWSIYRFILFTQVRRDLATRIERPDQSRVLRLSVVVPAYNEGSRITDTVNAIAGHLDGVIGDGSYEIIVVDDGSTDNTVAEAESTRAMVLVQDENRGKGAAVRRGMLQATGRAVVFTDADLAYPPSMVVTVMEAVEEGWDMVAGSRRHAGSDAVIQARRIRELGGEMVNRLTHLVLLGHFRDTQCGIKGFRGDIGRTMFERTRIDGFAFDVELFLVAEQDHLSLMEIPVTVANRAGSSVRLVADTVGLVADLFRIRRMAGSGDYLPSDTQAAIIHQSTSRSQRAD